MTTRFRSIATTLTVGALLLAACSTKSSGSQQNDSGGIKTGAGVSGDTITLGVLTDLSGPVSAFGKELANGLQLYWEQQNSQGKLCGKYTVKLLIKDSAYNPQTAVSEYPSMSGHIAAFQEFLGSAALDALASKLKSDSLLSIAQTHAASETTNPLIVEPGETFDYEAINGLDYLLKAGLLKDGATVGHIYSPGDYGSNADAGVQYVAKQHHLKVVQEKTTPTATDMTSQMTELTSKHVSAIVLSTTPNQTASVATVAAAQRLNVPLLGNTSTYAGGLLSTPAGPYLTTHFYTVQASAPLDVPVAAKVRAAYIKKFPGSDPQPVDTGDAFVEGMIMKAILDKACQLKDLTPQGIVKAKSTLTNLTTGGLTAPLDLSKNGSPAKAGYILRAAKVTGGEKLVEGPYEGPDAKTYQQALK